MACSKKVYLPNKLDSYNPTYEKYIITDRKKFLNHRDIKTTMHYLNVENCCF